MKRHSTDTRIISAFLRDTWLRDEQHATFTKLIRRSPPNHADNRGGHDATLRVQIISAIANWQNRSWHAFDAEIERSATRGRHGQKFANSVLVL
jgi:hypothetical protein